MTWPRYYQGLFSTRGKSLGTRLICSVVDVSNIELVTPLMSKPTIAINLFAWDGIAVVLYEVLRSHRYFIKLLFETNVRSRLKKIIEIWSWQLFNKTYTWTRYKTWIIWQVFLLTLGCLRHKIVRAIERWVKIPTPRPILKGHLFLLKVAGNINAHVFSYELPINLHGYSCVRKY